MATATQMRFSQFIDLLLARLYDLEQAPNGAGRFFDLNAITTGLIHQVPRNWVFDAAKVLESQGYARCIFAIGGYCFAQLTGEGRLFVENEKGSGVIREYHAAPRNFIRVASSNDPEIVGTEQHDVSAQMSIEKQREPAFQLLQEIEQQLRSDATVSDSERQDLLSDLAMVRGQLKKREPNRSALAALLQPLSQIASIAGSVVNLIKLLNP